MTDFAEHWEGWERKSGNYFHFSDSFCSNSHCRSNSEIWSVVILYLEDPEACDSSMGDVAWLGDLNMLSTKSMFPCAKSLVSLWEIFWALLGKILALLSWLFGVGFVSRQMEVAWNRTLDHLSMSKEGECSEGPTLSLGNTNLLFLIWPWLLPCALTSDFWPRGTAALPV